MHRPINGRFRGIILSNTRSASFSWLFTLGGKFFRVAPGPTLFVIPVTLVSQVSMLLASLLPLKVLILVGSDGVPHYFPPSLLQFDWNALVIALSVATPAFYFLHLAAEKLIYWASNIGAKRLLAQSKKVVLFEDQDEIATSSYRRYAGALANTVFIACVWLVLGVVNPPLWLLVVGYTGLCALGLWVVHGSSQTMGERIEDNLTALVPVLTALGFMLAFLLLVLQVLSGDSQNFIVVIASVLLTRQAFNRNNQLVTAVAQLYRKQRNLTALFFSELTLAQTDKKQKEFWTLFTPPQERDAWLIELLAEPLGATPKRLQVNWRQTAANNLVALELQTYGDADRPLGRFLVRVYGKSPSLLSSHEATLLLDESNESLPALPLVTAGSLGKWHYHVFLLPEGCEFVKPAKHLQNYLAALWAFEPPEDLTARYARSHPMLWQRLDESVVERLYIVANPEQQLLVKALEEQLPHMLKTLKNLPLALVNPDINANTLLQNASGELLVSDWARWALEPIGVNWPLSKKGVANLPEALQGAAEQRECLQLVNTHHVILAALLFQFDKLNTRQAYLDALDLIPRLLEVSQTSEDFE